MTVAGPRDLASGPVARSHSTDPAVERTRPLRVGLLLDGFVSAAWVEQVLRRVLSSGAVEIALVVLNDAPEPAAAATGRGPLQRVRGWYRNRHALAFTLYERLDRRRYASADDPTRPADLTALLGSAPVLRVRPRMTKFCDYFEDADLEAIAAHDLDVALRFGFRILKGGSLRIARHGVWSYHHGDNAVNRGGPPGFWEVMEQHAVTGAVLQRLTEDLDGGEILGRCHASTNPFSPTANRANYYWQATELLVSRLQQLAEERRDAPAADAPAPTWTGYSRRLYARPTTRELVPHAARLAGRLLRSKVRSLLVREQWIMGYRLAPKREEGGDVPDGVFYRFRELVPPSDRFWADPFPVFADGRHLLFFEEYRHADPHAHICVAEIDAQGLKGEPVVALRRPYHLSYPAVFQWEGDWYMTPETASRRAVELYRATRFPDQWEYVTDLVSGLEAVDPTIACIDGRWWMFVGAPVPGAREATALHLYSAPNPLGPWKPHRRNPVKLDVRSARPGGRVFLSGGRHHRVAQDGAPRYGSALRVHVIERLDDAAYEEREIAHLTPTWREGLVGVHTMNASAGLTAIDMLQRRRRL